MLTFADSTCLLWDFSKNKMKCGKMLLVPSLTKVFEWLVFNLVCRFRWRISSLFRPNWMRSTRRSACSIPDRSDSSSRQSCLIKWSYWNIHFNRNRYANHHLCGWNGRWFSWTPFPCPLRSWQRRFWQNCRYVSVRWALSAVLQSEICWGNRLLSLYFPSSPR